ncbi:MAG: ABC transporter permease [Chloroflexi bacterium]|nr:MAG: ABC transporter permease [Chloroflexota bacterium]
MMADTFRENRMAVVALGYIALVILVCFLGPLLYHTDQVHTNIAEASLAPGTDGHVLGTDDDGYDMLGRLLLGGQASLEVGLAAALIAVVFGALWGAVAGYAGGVVDAVMMRVVDTLLAIPALFALLVLAAIFTPSIPMLIVVVALVAWLVPARLVRGETLSLRTREYVEAVRVMGGGSTRIVLRHIIPNTIGTIMVNATFQVADAILLVAVLGFLGLGVPPPATDWGSLLSRGTNYVYAGDWWLIYPAGIAIATTVAAFNLVGDALRDSLEVRLQRR